MQTGYLHSTVTLDNAHESTRENEWEYKYLQVTWLHRNANESETTQCVSVKKKI